MVRVMGANTYLPYVFCSWQGTTAETFTVLFVV
jgi:hypothetical protein